jgi:5-methyltetrahydrofolate--homocysteine methyltransferase
LLDAICNRVLLGDGAMGTQLQAAGLAPGTCGEMWNLEHPDRVLAIQRAYVDAGSDCLITNTFGGCSIALQRHGLAKQARRINLAGARIAREAFGSRAGFVLGDIGPFGGFLEPLGDVSEASVRDAFSEQAEALVEGGVDAIIIETQVALEELRLAIEVSRLAGAACIIASIAYDATAAGDDLRTMMGVSPEQAAKFAREAGAHVIALNCGKGIDMIRAARCIRRYRAVCDLPTMAQPNGGSPIIENGKTVYRQTPHQMAAQLPQLLETGVNIVGACCGSTPAHIKAMRPIIDEHNRRLRR